MRLFGKKEIKATSPLSEEVVFNVIGSGPTFPTGGSNDILRLKYFSSIPEVNAILNLRARAAGNINIVAVDDNGVEVKGIKDDLLDVLNNPNYFQSRESLFGQTTLYKDIFGDEFMYAQVPFGMKKITGLFTIAPHKVMVVDSRPTTQQTPFFLQTKLPVNISYKFKNTDSKDYELNKDQLLHLTDNNVTYTDSCNFFRGTSKLDALTVAVENIAAAYEARNVLIVNRGAIGILSNSAKDGIGNVAPMNIKEKERVHQEFNKYGITKGKWQVIITNLALNWQQMAIDVDKLKLFEETKEDTLKICDSYGVPYELLSNIRNTTFDNKKEAQRQFYRDTIIPDANIRIAGMNKKFDTKNRGYTLVAKFDHLPIFETERKERASSLGLTINALSKALQDGAIDLDQYKLELIKFGIL